MLAQAEQILERLYDNMLIVTYAFRPERSNCEEAEREVQGRERHIHSERSPAILPRQLL
jgi:hypothetical protein